MGFKYSWGSCVSESTGNGSCSFTNISLILKRPRVNDEGIKEPTRGEQGEKIVSLVTFSLLKGSGVTQTRLLIPTTDHREPGKGGKDSKNRCTVGPRGPVVVLSSEEYANNHGGGVKKGEET